MGPTVLRDYQNAHLGSYKMSKRPWTSLWTLEERTSGDIKAIHQTERYYWSDGVLTAVLLFERREWAEECAQATRQPARPLFYGRKCCIPAAPLWRAAIEAPDVTAALLRVPVAEVDARRCGLGDATQVTLEADVPDDGALGERPCSYCDVPAGMDMRNRVHVGLERRRRVVLPFLVDVSSDVEQVVGA